MSKQLSHLSYGKILQDIYNFKRSGTSHGSDFNMYDTPGQKYFKILFYFGGLAEDETDTEYASGLLAPTWDNPTIINLNKQNAKVIPYYNYNSAWAYLKLNDENERADKLEQFVNLLSNINSEAPWYFTSISGIDAALERKQVTDEKMEIGERKRLSLACLPDAFDNRISTLLELYRDITWSWSLKKEIIPANLRKFDMAIYMFEAPEAKSLFMDEDDMPSLGSTSGFKPSYKMIEFHNCEFDYNSIKSGWSELNNQTGVNPTYTIEIAFDDCYEVSYNEHAMITIGDVIKTDTWQAIINDSIIPDPIASNELPKLPQIQSQADNLNNIDNIKTLLNEKIATFGKIKTFGNLNTRNGQKSDDINVEYKTNYNPGFISNAIGQVVGTLTADVKSMFNKAILGNLYTQSLSRLGDTVKGALQGNLLPTIQRAGGDLTGIAQKGQSVKEFMKNLHGDKLQASSASDIENGRNIAYSNMQSEGNLYSDSKVEDKEVPTNNIYPKIIRSKPSGRALGNIFKPSTIANNI